MSTITNKMTLLLAKKTLDVAVLACRSALSLLVFVEFLSLPFAWKIFTVGVVWAIGADVSNFTASEASRICMSYIR